MLDVRQVGGRQRNITFQIHGIVDVEGLDMTPVKTGQEKLKLTAALWLIQEKLGLHLWWDRDDLLLPMESRNSVRFDQAVPCPENWDGTFFLSSFSQIEQIEPKAVFVVLDFDR